MSFKPNETSNFIFVMSDEIIVEKRKTKETDEEGLLVS